MIDKKAADLAKQSFKLDREREALLQKTYKALSKELGSVLGVRFAQYNEDEAFAEKAPKEEEETEEKQKKKSLRRVYEKSEARLASLRPR